jgi:hypothetical protein
MCLGCDVLEVHVCCDRSLAELCLENASTRILIRQRNIDESVKTTRTAEGVIELLRSVGSTNDEDVLLGCHAVHFRQKLVHDTVRSTTSIAN